jgi:imidazoleglycerol-phosphate dehydratase
MTMARVASVSRQTAETSIEVTVNLDGTGISDISTGVGFFDHMLTALSRHSLVDLTVHVKGDTWVDDHHTVEDTGIVVGQALRQALGDKRGIRRYGDALVPLDEALVMAAVDISGRGELYWDVPIGPEKVGTFDTELGHEFFCGLARDAGMTVHLREVAGENAHHILESTFKSFARALRVAAEPDPRVEGIPSTKGAL